MSKKGNLSEALKGFDTRDPVKAEPEPQKQAIKVPEPADTQTGLSKQPPSRRNKKAITGWFEEGVSHQLKILAATDKKTVQSLLDEAINDLFQKYGKSRIT